MNEKKEFYENMENMENMERTEKKEKKSWKKSLRFIAGSAVFGMALGFGVFAGMREGNHTVPEKVAAAQNSVENSTENVAQAQQLSSIGRTNLSGASSTVIDVSDIVEAALPSVVAVNCVTYVQGSNMGFYGFYSYGMGSSQVREQNSCGTGILIGESNENLMVLTNNHVIEDTDKVSVVFSDGAEVEGSVLGSDPDADIAIVLIPLSNISSETRSVIRIAALGDSDQVKVGSAAVAIGNALGYGQSVTTGVISAVNREVKLTDKTMTLIQTDAAINEGNSGGPLLNASGEVIGINTVKYAASGVEGMGYAIPITDAKPIMEDIINGRTSAAQKQGGVIFGIYGITVTEQLQRLYQMPSGVYIYDVVANSPAQKYHVQAGHVITSIDGRSVASMEDLTAILQEHQAGDTITVTMAVPGRGQYTEETVQVVLAERED